MKAKLRGFASGVVFTVLLMGLIGTVSATRGRRMAELDYLDIRVTIDDKEISFADAPGVYAEPFTMDGTTYLPVRVIAWALGMDVAWDEATSTVKLTTENYRPQRNGFNSATNQKVKIGNYTFSLPNCWKESDTGDTDTKRYYAETNGKVAMIDIDCFYDTDKVSYDALVADNENMITAVESSLSAVGGKITGYETFQGGDDAKGILYSYTMAFNVEGKLYHGEGKLFCFPSEEDNKWFYVWMAASDNTEYTYDEDFTKILLTIKKDTVNQGSWVNPTPGSSSSSKNTGNASTSAPDMPNGSQTVYVTKSGSRYHYDSTCNGGTYYPATLQEAERRGLTPCQKCVLH